MKITVVLAAYNGQKFLLEQLESIYNQSIRVNEVIIVDDNSTDDTVVIIKKFIEDNKLADSWHLYQNEKNLGYKLNFKKAIGYATGDIIILSDQDDVWESDKVDEIKKVFEKTSALAVNTSFRFIDEEGKFVHVKESDNNNNLLMENIAPKDIKSINFETIIRNNISPGCTMAIRKELAEIFLNSSKGVLPHDWELNIIASFYGQLYFYNSKLTRYRIHDKNEIGMTTNLNKANPKPNLSYEKRCHNISERMKLKECIADMQKQKLISKEMYDIFLKLYKYDELRYDCVVKKKSFVWIRMVCYSVCIREYHYVRLRELIGDLYFSMTGGR